MSSYDRDPYRFFEFDRTTAAGRAAYDYLGAFSGNTVETKGFALRQFFNWCEEQGLDPLACRRPDIDRYVRYLESVRKNHPNTVAAKVYCLKNFYLTCVEDDLVVKNPMTMVKVPKFYTERSKMVAINRVILARLLEASHDPASKHYDRGIIALLGMLGLRAREAITLQVEDCFYMSRGHRTMRFVGKGNKAAELPISVFVAEELDYVIGDRSAGFVLERALADQRSSMGPQLSRQTLQFSLDRMCRIAKIDMHITPHMLRHGFVTAALDAGASLREVQRAARHSDPKTTMIYDHVREGFDAHAAYRVSSFIAGVM